MNRLTKKIRKPHRKYPATSMKQYKSIDLDNLKENGLDVEVITSCLANLQMNIEESRFYEIVTADIIRTTIGALIDTNPQIVINSLSAIQNLFRVSSFFSTGVSYFEELCVNLGLMANLEKLQSDVVQALQLIDRDTSVQYVCCALLSLLTELFESCSQGLLDNIQQSSFFNGTLSLIVQMLQKVISEEVFLGALNYLQVLSESVQRVNSLLSQSLPRILQLLEGDFSSAPILQESTFTYKLKVCSLLLSVVLNCLLSTSDRDNVLISRFRSTVGQLITNGLSVRIFKEVQNLKDIIVGLVGTQTQVQQIEGEEDQEQMEIQTYNLDQDKRVKNSLNIWLNTADAIIEQLRFIARLYEGSDQEEEQQTQIDQQIYELIPDYYKPAFQNEIFTIIYNNFYSLLPLLNEEQFLNSIQDYQIGNYIKEASLMITNASMAVLQNILLQIGKNQEYPIFPQLVQGIYDQAHILLTRHSLLYQDRQDFQDLLSSYLKCLVLLLSRIPQAINLPQQALISLTSLILSHKGTNEEHRLHLIQLLKLRYNSHIPNTIEIIEAVTCGLMNALQEHDALVGAWALDCLFDIYTEEDYNSILTKMNMLGQLQKGLQYLKDELTQLKSKMKSEDYKFIKLTLLNLKNFIQYKKKVMNIN